MKTITLPLLFLLLISSIYITAQPNPPRPPRPMPPAEKYGNTLNLGLGVGGFTGRYGYVGHSMPVFHMN